jgi:hypothetical protein
MIGSFAHYSIYESFQKTVVGHIDLFSTSTEENHIRVCYIRVMIVLHSHETVAKLAMSTAAMSTA